MIVVARARLPVRFAKGSVQVRARVVRGQDIVRAVDPRAPSRDVLTVVHVRVVLFLQRHEGLADLQGGGVVRDLEDLVRVEDAVGKRRILVKSAAGRERAGHLSAAMSAERGERRATPGDGRCPEQRRHGLEGRVAGCAVTGVPKGG